jgi:peptidoglycan/LPS O-acetylase OafA/YrhL
MQFYLIYGPLFTFLSRRTLVSVLIGFLFLAPFLRLFGGLWLQASGFSALRSAFAVYVLSPMHFDSFAAGALLALAPSAWRDVKHARRLLAGGLLSLAVYAGVFIWINHLDGAHALGVLRNVVSGILFGDTRQVWLYSAVALVGVGALALTLTARAPWSGLARSPALQWVGRVSYGGYLYHPLFMILARQTLRPIWPATMGLAQKLQFGVAVFLMALPLTILLASLSYRYVERPIIAAVNRRLAASPSRA